MNSAWKILLVVSIIMNCILGAVIWWINKVDRTPPWHPFELNSELTLKSLVDDGYRFDSAPCGQVQYTKQVNDTTIQYEIDVDCELYWGHYEPSWYSNDSLAEARTEKKFLKRQERREKKGLLDPNTNKFYPWDGPRSSCYQKIAWSMYYVNLGDKIDSLKVRDFISRKAAFIIETSEKWNATEGGSFLVRHRDTGFYFSCILKKSHFEPYEGEWMLSIHRDIPRLSQRAIRKDLKHRQKRDKYFDSLH